MALTVAAGVLGLGAADASAACGAHETRKGSARIGVGRPPLAIGDSVLAGAIPQVARSGIEVDAQCGRQLADGLRILRARRAAGRLPELIIWALGTNGPERVADVRAIRRIIGTTRLLVLVTPRGPVAWTAPTAAAYRRAASSYPVHVHVADWARLVGDGRGWLAGDAIHLNPTGARHFAQLLADTATRLLRLEFVAGGPVPVPDALRRGVPGG